MRRMKILNLSSPIPWWTKVRHGETFQITTKDGACFKTHAVIEFGVPLFKANGRIITPYKMGEVHQITQVF